MKVRLRTLCGCTSEIEMEHPVKVVEVPLPYTKKQLDDCPLDESPEYTPRHFDFQGDEEDGLRVYKERRCE
jgi:hypothetical protein